MSRQPVRSTSTGECILSGTKNPEGSRQSSGKLMCVELAVGGCDEIRTGLTNDSFQVDNRIRFGLANALALNLLKPGSTIVAVQGWKGGLGHTNTLRILSVPHDAADLKVQSLSGAT
jgi:hypothetical protein